MFNQNWVRLNSPPILDLLNIVLLDQQGHFDPLLRDAALRRMTEVAPEKAKAIVVEEFTTRPFSSNAPQAMSQLSDSELPEADASLFDRMASKPPNSNGDFNSEFFLFRRFASRAVEQKTVAFFNEYFAEMDCSERFDLLAYLHRVDSPKAEELFKRIGFSKKAPQTTSGKMDRNTICSIQPLAKLYWSPAIEAQEVATLDNADPNEVAESLRNLRLNGSPAARSAILKHFESWNGEWKAKAISVPQQSWPVLAARLDAEYLEALIDAYGWITPQEEIRRLGQMCLSDGCRNDAKQRADAFNYAGTFLTFNESSEVPQLTEYGFFPYGGVVGIERMESKISLFPQGTQFQVDGRSRSEEAVGRVIASLGAWMKAHGYTLSVYR